MNEENAIAIFSTLSNPTRLQILRRLVVAGDVGVSAGDIAEAVDATPSRASFHLSSMAQAGLVRSERMSRQITYFVNFDALGALVNYLVEDCCGGSPQLKSCC